MIIGVIRHNINDETGFRIDPSFHLSEATTIQSDMGNCPYPITTVSKVSDRIFIGNIFFELCLVVEFEFTFHLVLLF